MKRAFLKEIEQIIRGEHGDPFHILGRHRVDDRHEAVRAFLPRARSVWVIMDGQAVAMERVHGEGFFEAAIEASDLTYSLRVEASDGTTRDLSDPYSFPPVLSDFDLHLIAEGNHYYTYQKLGAHLMVLYGVSGVFFAVWAPNAQRVSVIGDFNDWDGRCHPMRNRHTGGIWELFVPELGEGELYKFSIKSNHGEYLAEKADSYGFRFELRPRTATMVHNVAREVWNDSVWMANRARSNALDAPISVYEVHPGSWRRVPEEADRFLTYRELARELVPYVKDMGYTHIELLPVTEHPFEGSWGYQTVGYFAPTSRYGTPDDFKSFVDYCHLNGIGVLLDWVPAHFPTDQHGLAFFDGTFLYEHADPRKGFHQDWGTLIFNYGRNEVRNFLLTSALFWLDRYHIDGLRVDAVASMLYLDYSRNPGEWIPNPYGGNENLEAIDFLKKFNELVHRTHPGVLTIAEESTAWPQVSRPTYVGGLGFSLKWNMGWMNDLLRYMSLDPVHRKYHHNDLTFSILYAFTENFVLPFSHDEVVHGKRSLLSKMPGDVWQKFANLRLLYTYMFGHPGKKLMFMGSEFGQWNEWNHNHSLDWHLLGWETHRRLQSLVRDLNRLYVSEPALHQVDFDYHGFEWIDFHDWESSVVSFLRRAKDPNDILVFVSNFTPVPRHEYRIGVPHEGFYEEIFNSDSAFYGGSNMGNHGGAWAEPIVASGRPFSVRLTLPPLATIVLKPTTPAVELKST